MEITEELKEQIDEHSSERVEEVAQNAAKDAFQDYVDEHNEPFATAIIDPPWPYTLAPGKKDGTKPSSGKGKLCGFIQGGYADAGYSGVMSIREMAAIPVGDLVSGYVFCGRRCRFCPLRYYCSRNGASIT
jgi:hypothetical protein